MKTPSTPPPLPTPSSESTAFTLASGDPSAVLVTMSPSYARRLARLIRRHAPTNSEGGGPLRALGLQIETHYPAPTPESTPS